MIFEFQSLIGTLKTVPSLSTAPHSTQVSIPNRDAKNRLLAGQARSVDPGFNP